MCKCKRFLYFFFSFFVGTTASIYLAEEKYGIANWCIEGKKKNILHYCVHTEENDRQIKEWNRAMETVILNKF